MKILSWNIAFLPEIINEFKNSKNRLNAIKKLIKISNPDIICFQEVFSNLSRKVLVDFLKHKYYITLSPKTYFILNGGLLLASKYPIVDVEYNVFKNRAGEDALCQKGIIYAKIKYKNKYINVYNTHLNNDTPKFCFNRSLLNDVKRNQLNEYLKVVYNKLFNTNIDINILTGDFNLDFGSQYYKAFLSKLGDIFKICSNKKEIITNNLKNNQIDYIMTACHNSKKKYKYKLYSYSRFKEISDHNPLIKKINI